MACQNLPDIPKYQHKHICDDKEYVYAFIYSVHVLQRKSVQQSNDVLKKIT